MIATASPCDRLAEVASTGRDSRIGAFFDLDGTLVAGFTATAHAGDRIRRRQARRGEVLGVAEAAVRYRLGRMQFERLLVRAAGYLRGESIDELNDVGERLFDQHITERVYPHMREIVRAHQERGHTVVLSSSALTIHAEPVARHLGIPQVVCNRFELDEAGVLTGDIVKPVVWGAQKAAAVQDLCATRGIDLERSFFYADGDEDAALMSLVGRPRPVNPRPRLAALAARHGWPVLQVSDPARGTRRSLRQTAGFGVALLRAISTH
ncbi:HAD-IB family hydrolase [Mycobacterium sp. M1]|uniref:HAD-IB family hydrolase n=1 Tax=Mycolicibacter acidiphilus TaxID=2835306 RepID=A0ABS5REP8_9MYCO|nr:HAD-IB family hydrolase [Mycolicibacter acidiphilus]MBS9532743.1 HAD-IB family hydrolase [Mycolicibacter acidiphilus]